MANVNDKIICEICGAKIDAVAIHIKKDHPEITEQQYAQKYPSAPLMSEYVKEMLEKRKLEKLEKERAAKAEAQKQEEQAAAKAKEPEQDTSVELLAKSKKDVIEQRPLHVVFDINSPSAKNSKGAAIPVSCIGNSSFADLVPEVNNTYVYDMDVLKNVLLALELQINPYVWGHKGCGKSELFEQIAARTGRPFVRVQHTANTEESHIVGMWTVKGGQTIFELGPLALAMQHGWVYLADEYDFALPSVLSVYQAVLEGKPLMIKEADSENRVIKPHPNFRFVATGNTNGTGDDTGLYQGTNLQNSANYDRFGMVVKKNYMPKAAEVDMLMRRVGLIEPDATKLVEFASLVRDAYDGSKISDTISPRSLIDAGTIAKYRHDFKESLRLAFTNKLARTDSEIVEGLAQRVFG
ncbi:AAA family ATPase [Acinetobacter brisouii]|uniref:AAA family ATPase n=1 Tax=Acinetobacter brisouii TaxID=396323 RepID=UPI00124DA7DD|nr:MoxR family ATPase [Acinetobacter brisouii]